jgi:hypothetical protein
MRSIFKQVYGNRRKNKSLESRIQNTGARIQNPESRNQKPEARNQNPEARNQKPEARNQKPETRNQKPETRNPVPPIYPRAGNLTFSKYFFMSTWYSYTKDGKIFSAFQIPAAARGDKSMERRIRFFEQMRNRLENMDEETVDLKPKEEAVEKMVIKPGGKQEYTANLKQKLAAWSNELDKWETEAYQVDLDEECAARLADLDYKLAEGYEKLRDLLCSPDEEWDSVQKNAEKLWREIVSTFDQIRHCVGEKMLG